MPAEEQQSNDKVEEKDNTSQLSEESKEITQEAANNEEESTHNDEENSGVAVVEVSPAESKIEETEDDFRIQPPFVCCCGASFQFLGQITSHKKKNCDWIYVCPHCDRVYKDFDKMTAHKGTHDTTKSAEGENKEIKDGDSTNSKTEETTKDTTVSDKSVEKTKTIVPRPQNTAPVNNQPNNKPRFQKTNNQSNYMGGRPTMGGMMNPQMGGMGNFGMNPMMMGNMGMNSGMGQFGPMNPMMMGNFMPYNHFCQPNMMNMMPNMGMANMNQNMGYMGGPNMAGPHMGGPNMGGSNMGGPNMGFNGPNMGGPNMGFSSANQMGNFPPIRGSKESHSKGRSDANYSPRSLGRNSSPGRPGDSPPLDNRRRELKFDKDDDCSDDMIDPPGKHSMMERRAGRYSGGESDSDRPGERSKLAERYSDRGGSDSEKDSFYWARRSDELMQSKRGQSGGFFSKSNINQRDSSEARISNSYGFRLKRETTDLGPLGLQSKMMRTDSRF